MTKPASGTNLCCQCLGPVGGNGVDLYLHSQKGEKDKRPTRFCGLRCLVLWAISKGWSKG